MLRIYNPERDARAIGQLELFDVDNQRSHDPCSPSPWILLRTGLHDRSEGSQRGVQGLTATALSSPDAKQPGTTSPVSPAVLTKQPSPEHPQVTNG